MRGGSESYQTIFNQNPSEALLQKRIKYLFFRNRFDLY